MIALCDGETLNGWGSDANQQQQHWIAKQKPKKENKKRKECFCVKNEWMSKWVSWGESDESYSRQEGPQKEKEKKEREWTKANKLKYS